MSASYTGSAIENGSAKIEFRERFQLNDIKKGIYEFSFQMNTVDQGDYLVLSVEKGSLSIWEGQQWVVVTDSVALRSSYGPEPLKIKVDRLSTFSFETQDSYDYYPYDDAPTNPQADFFDLPFNFDMGNSRGNAANLGKLDPLTGESITWDNGQMERAEGERKIAIRETIGGNDASDFAKFVLTKPSGVAISTEGAIFELIDGKTKTVIGSSSDFYSSQLNFNLAKGTYYLHYSSESSSEAIFNSEVQLLGWG